VTPLSIIALMLVALALFLRAEHRGCDSCEIELHKNILLLRAGDVATRHIETRDGPLVAETLRVEDDKLERAIGL
jgi:hypothetical protein